MALRHLPLSLAIAVAVLLAPYGAQLIGGDSMVGTLVTMMIFAIVVVSYRLLAMTGEFSLAHVVIMGVGAYASALAAKQLGIPLWLSIPLGGLVAALVALILAFPLFRMKGFYFLIGSFAAGEAIRLSWIRFRDPFGGTRGISLIPGFDLTLPGLGRLDFFDPINAYFMITAVTAVALFLMYRIERSRIGLTLNAIHWKDLLAESVGVNLWRYRTLALVLASFFAGIAGALFAHNLSTINPRIFSIHAMLLVLVWVIVGGTRTFWGPIIGLIALTVVDQVLRLYIDLPPEWRPAIFGIILILAVMFLPQGLESLPGKIRGWLGSRRPPPGMDVRTAE
ncbi:MAG: branched-chain amino acid ABC transporter permease [Alphaproteobacteria bacterium]